MYGWLYSRQGVPRDVLQLSKALAEPKASRTMPIIVNVHAVALNPDSSVLMRIWPNILLRSTPRIPEIDFAGIITEIRQSAAECSYRVGDEVFGHIPPVKHVTRNIGVLAERVAVSPDWIIPKPASLGFEEAAALPTAFVSAYKLALKVQSGARVFVNGGSGGVGLTLLQLLKNWKHANVTTTASDQSWHIVEKQRPDTIVNYREIGDLAIHLQNHLESFDYVIDLVGDTALLKQSHRYLRKNGMFIAFGGGLSSTTVWGFLSWFIRTIVTGFLPSWLGGSRRTFRFVAVAKEFDSTESLRMLEEFVSKGWVKPCIDSVYDFKEVFEGYDRLLSRRADGKIVIRTHRGLGSD